ncbi:uncharacterized protein LOC117783674 [Drosophila innubila]|uniref:uncharacterized protein LOC117783674 n=1 Tax=Drosophila innubila TaxID=198719 RepID=UPI00148BB04D|nr:uncharacterized protein LOC117783674 [Drosophila innubila]
MKYLCLTTIFVLLLIGLAEINAYVDESPTFTGVCELQGDWCSTRCQLAGGRDGICNKMRLCICRPL